MIFIVFRYLNLILKFRNYCQSFINLPRLLKSDGNYIILDSYIFLYNNLFIILTNT